MSRTIPVGVPAEAVAGDTLEFDYSHSDFPVADGWAPQLILRLRGNVSLASQAGHVTTVGNLYRFKIPAAEFDIEPGDYQWTISFTSGPDRVTPDQGAMQVTPNPTKPFKSHAEKMIEIIEARLEGRVIADIESYSIGGRSITQIPLAELRGYRVQLYAELRAEQGETADDQVAFVCP